ncbi:MAG: glutamine--tRNA ligase/YqeY domain fusion protein, partial [Chloroflexi bacterium]|nr:glutamine--tRNA ligase/YqeY domain fusion protein [Chloroflexota bacterium]
MSDSTATPAGTPSDFIRTAVAEDLRSGRFDHIATRFPPEPNGYLHIGHAKAIAIDFGIAAENGGICNLRFDDTNPAKEEQEYVDAIMADIRWLGYQWNNLFFASDYFEQIYQFALDLIQNGKAFVCDLTADEMRSYRGTLTEPGRESPYRNRSIEENLNLFERMRAGEFAEGTRTLRAKIDMSAGNINMRDPVMYRIIRAEHHRTGDKWCVYPMYDFAHGQSDSIEGISHSLCSLEYEDHRPLYDWYVRELGIYAPRQIEFARLKMTYTVMSKRKLLELVRENHVRGWDDPRMPTLCGMRRRGYTPEAVRNFITATGVSKANSTTDLSMLEAHVRDDLNKRALRVMGVLQPLKVIIENYPEGETDWLDANNNPEDPAAGTRKVPFARELYIEQEDFREEPPPKYFRLSPGREVRLRCGYFIKCERVVKDAAGNVVELRCTYDPATRGGDSPDGRKVKATIHWVSAVHALRTEVRQYETLFSTPNPDEAPEDGTFLDNLNPNSLSVIADAMLEPSVAGAAAGTFFQFERVGYFCVDPDSTSENLIFNRTVGLKD